MNPVKADLAPDPVPDALPTGAAQPLRAPGGESLRSSLDSDALAALATRIKTWGGELGFDAVGISDTDLSTAEHTLQAWLAAGFHGQMDYMAKHGLKRARPAELVPGTLRVISLRMAYLPAQLQPSNWRAAQFARNAVPGEAVVSVYARGRDYHKVLRNRLQKLAERIEMEIGPFGYRVFTDSAPVLEVELAQKARLGWRGKHTLLLERDAGSFFFLGELFVDLPLPIDAAAVPPVAAAPPANGVHCGSCSRCIDVCPTGAIVAPYQVDARRCISYLTIELAGSIPEELRPLIGNRIYGCDDCQLVCPWNKFAKLSQVDDFEARNGLEQASLIDLWQWTENDFEARLAGTAIRRIGYERWVRNLAVGLGNALRATPDASARAPFADALRSRLADPSALIREHVEWALRAA
ncbi:tRNA epoxyqueuosine(34) reductase QueG [Pararobbsia alpina]|nr:tRNA epoxyqueuosine(34) reductase QueG [Pararobbsia alpina]